MKRIRGGFFINIKPKVLTAIMVPSITLVGFLGLRFFASAQNGDFVNNVKTSVESSKTTLLTGEMASVVSRISVTNDSNGYKNAYLLVKIPKANISERPTYSVTSSVNSQQSADDGQFWVQRFNYNSLNPGEMNTINYTFKTNNFTTPDNTVVNVVHELYDGDNNVISRQSKDITYNAKNVDLYNAEKQKINGNDNNMQYIATYTDTTNTSIDSSSFRRMGRVTYRISTRFYDETIQYGRVGLREYTLEDTLPEHTELSQESKDYGWVFDSITGKATLTKQVVGNPESISENITIVYKESTPESIIGTKVVNNAKIKANFVDSRNIEKDVSKTITVQALKKQDLVGGNIRPIKGLGYAGFTGHRHGSFSNGAYNFIDYIKNAPMLWSLGFDVINDGSGRRIAIDSIVDMPSSDLKVVENYMVIRGSGGVPGSKILEKMGVEKLEVIATASDGASEKIGEFIQGKDSLNKIKDLPENTVSLKLKFPDGATIPTEIDGADKYEFRITVSTAFKDRDAVSVKIPNDGSVKSFENEMFVNLSDGSSVSAKNHIDYNKRSVKIDNNIGYNGGGPVRRLDQQVPFDISPVNQFDRRLEYIESSKMMLLYPQHLILDVCVKDAISRGDIQFIYDYKGTGKSAIITSKTSGQYNFGGCHSFNLFKISEVTPSGVYGIDLYTYWDDSDLMFYGTAGLDGLDLNNDGNTNSVNVAYSTTQFSVERPEQIAAQKDVRNKTDDGYWSKSITGLEPGDEVEYRLSVINTSTASKVSGVRMLDILPYVDDKNIVEGNDGIQASRGSTMNMILSGPIKIDNRFNVSYSIDSPGLSQAESWAKNFVNESAISDWSKVRMIKVTQNNSTTINENEIISIVFTAKVPDNAKSGQISNNSVAVALRDNIPLVEAIAVSASVNYKYKLSGMIFDDNNSDGIFNKNDLTVGGIEVELYKDGKATGVKAITSSDGKYEIDITEVGNYSVVATVDDNKYTSSIYRGVLTSDISNVNSGFETVAKNISKNNKEAILNIGLIKKGALVTARFTDEKGEDLKDEVIVKPADTPVGTTYNATKEMELIKDNLVYIFKEVKAGGANETGIVQELAQTVTFVYSPKVGGGVNIRFIDENGNEIQESEIVATQDIQVGTPYKAKYPNRITKDGRKYNLKFIRTEKDDAKEKGVVNEYPQVITVVYEIESLQVIPPNTGVVQNQILRIITIIFSLVMLTGPIFVVKKF